jgi:phosphoribosylformimino-5-aminoimidazole carboxamide ribotide isomerase
MLVIPAIDIKAGSVVRLIHGDPKQQTTYSSDPVEVAKQWVAQGAQRLHVVDLDGAFSGQAANIDLLFRIKDAVNVVVQFGGGLRDPESVRKVLEKGVGAPLWGPPFSNTPNGSSPPSRNFPAD